MKLLEEKKFTTELGIVYGIQIEFNNQIIWSKPVPEPDITADSILESTVEATYCETLNQHEFDIKIYSSLNEVVVHILGDEDSIIDFEIVLQNDYTCPLPEELTPSSNIDTYVPMIKYTRSTKELCDFVLKESNKNFMPVMDIRKEEQINEYLTDNFNFRHFLDLCGLQSECTKEERLKALAIRKDQKRQKIPEKERTQKVDKKYIDMLEDEKYNSFITLEKKQNVIPIWRISTEKEPISTKYEEMIIGLFATYNHVAWRVTNIENFEKNIEKYLKPLNKFLDQCYLIIEFLGDNRKQEWLIIKKILDMNCGIQIIFAKQTLDYEHARIKTNHINLLPNTSLGSFYEHNKKSAEEIWYSDYCGYDRDTATIFIRGMKPNASLHLLDFQDGMQMLILKIKHPDEKGTASWLKSVLAMIHIIQKNVNVKKFINCKHCEMCEYICTTETFTLESAKVACMKHNLRVISTI